VLYIVPQDRSLVITARIPPIHVDEISPGQVADVVVSAFSGRDTPHLRGRVTRISADALTDPHSGIPFYAVEIELPTDERSRLGSRVLMPGMPVQVFLQTGQHTALTYLTKPFTDYFSRAFREG
jgi:HlyD family secretion protein